MKVVKAVLSNVNSVSSVAVFVAVLPTSLVFLRLLISFLQMKRERSRGVKYIDIGTYRFQFSDIGASGAFSKNLSALFISVLNMYHILTESKSENRESF